MAASAPGDEPHSAVARSMWVRRLSNRAASRLSATMATTMIATGTRARATAPTVSGVTEAPTVSPRTTRAAERSHLGGSPRGACRRLAMAVASMAPVKAPPGRLSARAATTPTAPTRSVPPTFRHVPIVAMHALVYRSSPLAAYTFPQVARRCRAHGF